MTESNSLDLNQRIAQRVRGLRAARGLTLEGLAEKSGVSRSMISAIERGDSNPTAVVLERISVGLGVPLASLFEASTVTGNPLSLASEQTSWRDPASGYVRRNVSPAGFPSPIQIVAVDFPPRATVSYETGARDGTVHQQVWVLEGEILLSYGATTHHLHAGDCLAHQLDRPITFHNPTDRTTRYAVVLVSQP